MKGVKWKRGRREMQSIRKREKTSTCRGREKVGHMKWRENKDGIQQENKKKKRKK